MNAKNVLFGIGAFAAAAAAIAVLKNRGALHFGGDAERMAGVKALYDVSSGQQAGVSSAVVAANWKALDSVFKTEPDFWV